MQRNSFLRLCVAAGALPTVPFSVYAKQRAAKGFMVPAGKNRSDNSIPLLEGDTFYTKFPPPIRVKTCTRLNQPG